MAEAATKRAVEQVVAPVHRAVSAVSEAFDEGVEAAKHIGKRSSDAAEELMDDTTERIKRHPAETVVMAFAAGLLLGGFFSWCLRHR